MTKKNPLAIQADNLVVEYPEPSVKTNTLKEWVVRTLDRSLTYKNIRALNDVSFDAAHGECIAFIGHNGCGKSTSLKCIAGILEPKAGQIQVEGLIAPLIELGTGFDPELTGRENVYLSCSLLGISKDVIDSRIGDIEAFAELGEFFNFPIKSYSSGMYMRLGFACATLIDPDILIIDEILSVGDENFQKKSFDRMMKIRASGATIVLVSHDMGMVQKLADRVYVLHNGQVVYIGHPAEAVRFYLDKMEDIRVEGISDAQRQEELRLRRLRASAGANLGPKGRIIKAEVSSELGVNKAQSGKPWNLTISYELEEAADAPVVVGFAIWSEGRIRVTGGNTKGLAAQRTDFSPDALTKAGKHSVTFHLDNLDLASGHYIVVAAVHNQTLEYEIDYKPDCSRFDVVHEADADNFDHDIVPAASAIVGIDAR